MAININPGSPLRHVATFNASGTWTAPANTNIAFVAVHGSTGGGGIFNGRYVPNVGNQSTGTGGAGRIAGAYVQVTPSTGHAVTIGAGGAPATANSLGNNRSGSATAAGAGGTTLFDGALSTPGSGGGPNGGSRYSSQNGTGDAANTGSGTTSLTSLNPGESTLARVGTITNQTTGGSAGGAGSPGTNSDTRYTVPIAPSTGASGIVHVYI